jgi:hypothetical protein
MERVLAIDELTNLRSAEVLALKFVNRKIRQFDNHGVRWLLEQGQQLLLFVQDSGARLRCGATGSTC